MTHTFSGRRERGHPRPRRRDRPRPGAARLPKLDYLEERSLLAGITQFPIPTAATGPQEITKGPDGALWFTEYAANAIGRVSTTGVMTEYPIPTSGGAPWGITAGPDGALWFTEAAANKIGRVTTAGVITEFTVPTPKSRPQGITTGPDGALWFAEFNSGQVGRVTTSGAFTGYPIPVAGSTPLGICAGPDGALWFTDNAKGLIGRLTTSGTLTEYATSNGNSQPDGICVGPDGALWFAEFNANKIGRITTAGALTEFPVPGNGVNPDEITAGPDGNLWFTENDNKSNNIASLTTSGVVTVYPTPAPTSGNNQPLGITAGPDGAIWFTENGSNQIGRMTVAPATNVITVDTTADVVDGSVTSITALLANKGTDGHVSLREAIKASNNTPGPNTILFAIPDTDPNRYYYRNDNTPGSLSTPVRTTLPDGSITDFDPDYPYAAHSWFRIDLNPALPELQVTNPVVINGYSQPGASPNTLNVGDNASIRIELTCTAVNGNYLLSNNRGLDVSAGGGGSTIRGLAVNRFGWSGIMVDTGADGTTVEGDFLGTDVTGTVGLGNGDDGVQVRANHAVIGGSTPDDRNVSSGNLNRGLNFYTSSGTSDGNLVENDYFGVDATGTHPLGNAAQGVVGYNLSNSSILNNVISANASGGLWFRTPAATGNTVQGNLIGTNATGASPLGNSGDGVLVNNGASGELVGGTAAGQGNVIADNRGIGVNVSSGTGTAILGNSISGNTGLGIDLNGDGVTPNDGAKTAGQPDLLMDSPVITSAVINGTTLNVSGYVGSVAGQGLFGNARVEVFTSDNDPRNHGQGATYLGYVTAAGDGSFSGSISTNGLSAGASVTATATDSGANTSEFATNAVVTSPPSAAFGGANTSSSVYGQTVTITATISGPSGTPTGTVTFLEGTTVLDTAPLTGGTATFTTSSLPAGTHHVTARYSGDGRYPPSTSAPFTEVVNAAPLSVTADSPSKIYGAALPALTFTYSGLVNGDTSAVFSGGLNTLATATSGVGTYAVNSGTLSAGPNYTVSFNPGTLTVTPATLTVTANGPTKVYGDPVPALGYGFSGLVNGDTPSVFTGALNTPASASSGVGGYQVNQGSLSAGANYLITYNAGSLTVTPAALGVTADPVSKVYGAALPALTFTYSGLVNGDTAAVFSGGLVTTATARSHAGPYAINRGTLSAGPNYAIGFSPGSLTVTPAPLTVTASDGSRPYGRPDPPFTAAYAGLVNGDTPGSLGGPLVFRTTAAAASPPGAYPVTPGGLTSADYAITYDDGTLTVTRAALTITADDDAKVYGAPNPGFAASYTGLVNGDNPSVVSGLTFSTQVTAASNVGTYGIVPGGASAADYTITYRDGSLTISPANVSVAADSLTKSYGAPVPALTFTTSGLVNGDTAAVFSGALSTSATAASDVGAFPIRRGTLSAGPNYVISFDPGTLTVTPAPLVITANDAVRAYGQPDPVFTASFSGLVNGDASSVVSGLGFNTPATRSSSVGSYGIVPGNASAANYTISYVNGSMTVDPVVLTVTADSPRKLYGSPIPSLDYAYSGLVDGDTSAVFRGALATTATEASGVGGYPVTLGTLSAGVDYVIRFETGTVTVTPAPLTVTASDGSRPYGRPDPPFTAAYAGLVNGDTPGSLGGPLVFRTTAAAASPPGAYPVTPGGLTSADYAITFHDGTLTVEPLSIAASGATINAVEGVAFSGVVATFASPDPTPRPESYTATIQWGDGNDSVGVVGFDTTRGVYTVEGTNTYQAEGVYAIGVSVRSEDTITATARGVAVVTDAPLQLTGNVFSPTAGRSDAVTVATLSDGNPSGRPSDFSVRIDWGDGTASTGTVVPNDGGGFLILGTHTYDGAGSFKVQVGVADQAGPRAGVVVGVRVVAPTATGDGATPAVPKTEPQGGRVPTQGDPIAFAFAFVGGPAAPPLSFAYGPAGGPGLTAGPIVRSPGAIPVTPSPGVLSPGPALAPAVSSGPDPAPPPAGAPGSVSTGDATGTGKDPAAGILQAVIEQAMDVASRQLDALLGALARAGTTPGVRAAIPDRDGLETRTARADLVPPSGYLWGRLDELDRQLSSGAIRRQVAEALGTGVVAYVGYVLLNGRGGFILASLLTARPLWAQVDPLAVLLDWERDRKREPRFPDDEESLQSLLEGGQGRERDEEGHSHDAAEPGARELDRQPPVRRARGRGLARQRRRGTQGAKGPL